MDGHAIDPAEEVVQCEVHSLANEARAAVHVALVGVEGEEPPLDDIQIGAKIKPEEDLAQRDRELFHVEAIHREVRQVAHLAPPDRPVVGLETHDDVLVGEPGLSRDDDGVEVDAGDPHAPGAPDRVVPRGEDPADLASGLADPSSEIGGRTVRPMTDRSASASLIAGTLAMPPFRARSASNGRMNARPSKRFTAPRWDQVLEQRERIGGRSSSST